MSYQAGIFYFDKRPLHENDIGNVIDAVSGSPSSWMGEGIFMARAEPFATAIAEIHVTPAAAITFDGRIDNRSELRLFFDGRANAGSSDAELALSAYEDSGLGGFASLVGDFSLVLYDRVDRRLVLASDFAGVRPLYYRYASGSHIRWSTRLKPLAEEMATDELDDEYVAGLLLHGGCPNRTPYPGIHSVPPGHYVAVSASGIEIRPFWTLPVHDSIRYTNESDYAGHLRALFREAVQCRIDTPAPVLCELSGGLDSSSVACMGRQLLRSGEIRDGEIVTLSYDHKDSRDKRFQEIVEAHCGFESVHLSATEFPFLSASHPGDSQPHFWKPMREAISRLALQRDAGTLLTGGLGDLTMGNWFDDSTQILGEFRKGHLLSGLRESLEWSLVLGIPIPHVWARAIPFAYPGLATNRASQDDSISPEFRRRLRLSERDRFFSPVWTEAPPERRMHFRGLGEVLAQRRLQAPESLTHLSYTHPYGHRPLVQFMLSIPPQVVCGPGEPRKLMRQALSPLWPPELRRRRSKDSFGGVFLDSLRPLAGTLLKGREPIEVVERGYVDRALLAKRLNKVVNSFECNVPQLSHVLALEFWLRGRRRHSELNAGRQLNRARAADLIKRSEASGDSTTAETSAQH